MKEKRILSLVTLLALVLSLTGGLPVSRMKEVSAAEGRISATTEKVLIPEEKCWQYEEIGNGTVCITGFNDEAVYTWEDREKEYTWDENGVGRGTTYKLVVPQTIAGKKVTCVGGSGFYQSDRMITAIQIPEGVTSIREIGEYSLISAELPSTLETIGEYAFWSGIDIPSSLTNVVIPDKVKEIERGAFFECDKLSSIRLPAGLESIGDQAFYGCRSLQNMVIPASVFDINETAFADCRSIKAYEVEANNKGNYYAENGILYQGKNLISYPGAKEGVCTLTADMEYSWTAFLNCKGLTAINVDTENPYYSSVDGVVYQKDMKILQICPAGKTGEYTVPEGVRSLQTNSFSNSALHTIHLPDSLGETYMTEWGEEETGFIGNYSFYQCDALQTITIGKSTTKKILSYLDSAPNLKNISISEDNPTLCSVDNVVYDKEIKKLLFVSTGIEGKLVLPDTVETSASIGGNGITELFLGKNYNVTEKTAVYDDGYRENYLTGLPRLEALQTYEVSPANQNLVSYDGVLYSKDFKKLYHCPPQKKGAVTIPDGTVVIWEDSFEDCYDIEEITIPASVTDIQLSPSEFWNITIKGYTGSAAEAYVKRANEKGRNIKFISLGTVVTQKPNPAEQQNLVQNKKKETAVTAVKNPKKATLKKVKALGKRKVKVTWKKLAATGGYQLQYAMNRSFTKKKKTKSISKTASSTTLKNLKKGKTYYFRIRAYNKAGGSKKYGKWSNIKKIKVK